jgi:hypothetical protein
MDLVAGVRKEGSRYVEPQLFFSICFPTLTVPNQLLAVVAVLWT